MDKGGENSPSDQIYPAQVPCAPTKPGRSDPNVICEDKSGNQFNEAGFEETPAKGWEGNLGSTSQPYDINVGMYKYNSFSMDNVETWHTISCRDLLALADATIIPNGYGGGAMETNMQFMDHGSLVGSDFDSRGNSTSYTQQFGRFDLSGYLPGIGTHLSMGLSSHFTPVTPDQSGRAEHGQVESDVVISNEEGRKNRTADNEKERSSLDEQPQLILEQSQANVSALVDTNQDFEKGLSEETNLIGTPQPKQRRRKHRPKVVTEGQPKRAKKPTSPNPNGSSTGKRKYVRRKGVENATAMPAMEEANGTIDPSTDQQTRNSCRRRINFDEPEQGTEVMIKKTQDELTVDKTCPTDQGVEAYPTIHVSQSASPITPSKTELPHKRSVKPSKQTYTKGKCQINFLQETHEKGLSSIPSPNESNCSTSACFNKGEEARGSKRERSTQMNGLGVCYESLEAYLSMFTDYNSGSIPGMHLPAIYKKRRIGKGNSSMTSDITSVCSQQNDCTFSDEPNATKSRQMSEAYGVNDDHQSCRCMQASGHLENSKKKRTKALTWMCDSASFAGMMEGRQWRTPEGAAGYEASHQQHTYMETHAADFKVGVATKKRIKKKSIVPPLFHNHQCLTNHLGCHPNLRWKSIYDFDALINQFEQLDINRQMGDEDRGALTMYLSRHQEKNALVLYQQDGSLVPFEGFFNPMKRRKPRPKVDLDNETSRVWRLLLEDINSQGIDGTDEDKAKWWEEERRVFRGRADSFIARMHLVQGDRRFSQWKGSVLDSVIGVFLTQNVSDHLSSSAFMSLAARYPLKSKISSEPLQEENSILSVKEPCQVDQDETIGWHEKSNQPTRDQASMMLKDNDSCEEKEVNSNEFSKSSIRISLNDNPACDVLEESEKDLAMYKESDVDQIEADDMVSSQNSTDTSPSSVQSSIAQSAERLGSYSADNSGEEQKDRSEATVHDGCTSFIELLHMQGPTKVHESYCQRQDDEASNKKNEQDELRSKAYSQGQNDGISPASNITLELMLSPKNHELPNAPSSEGLEVEYFELKEERKIIQKESEKESASEESRLTAEFVSQAKVQMARTASSQEAPKSCNTFQAGMQEIVHCETMAENPKVNTDQHTDDSRCEMREVLDIVNVSTEASEATESNNVVEASRKTVHKVVEFSSNDCGSYQVAKGMDEGSSEVKKGKTRKVKQIKVEWDSLRLQAEVKQKRERTPNTMDSLDYDAVRRADVAEIADTIKERGMNNVLAERIKDLLDRLVRDHGSIDLEWLRDVPPDKAKEYLLSFRGLGLKSVECVRLLTLHHLAFPVDTNVGRIAVRLGWVPLQPLPESLQLHLLELYPVLESIQQYLWPRLCKLDQRTLYELHYQMITFGKVFCTKSKPNCNACPMRGECRHFASAFASARLGLPAPEEKGMVSATENRTDQSPIGLINQQPLALPPANEQLQELSEVPHCNPVIEHPATPGPLVEVPATPEPLVEVPATPEPIVEVPATPEPEQMQQEQLDIEDFCEDPEEIPMIKLNIEEFTQNLQTYMEKHMELGEGDMPRALVALTSEAASIPTPKLKNVSQLRTEHQVYELPDSHPLLEGLDTREPDDPCSYLLAIWTPGETADSIQPPGGQCCSQESDTLCNEETCFFCNSKREANSQTVRGTLLIPCRTAMRGSFPLNGTYFQVNEVFADHESSLNPIDVPRSWLWNLPRRTVYFGTSIPTIFKGLTTEDIQYCFWRGFVCVRGFDQKTRAPRPLMARLHFPASKIRRSRGKADDNRH